MPTVESSLMSESSSDSVRTRTVSVAATVTVTPTVVALRMNHNVEQVFLAISNYGVNLAPITFLTILVERAMATAYSKVYERLHSTAMQAVLVLIGVKYSLIVTNETNNNKTFFVRIIDSYILVSGVRLFTLRNLKFFLFASLMHTKWQKK